MDADDLRRRGGPEASLGLGTTSVALPGRRHLSCIRREIRPRGCWWRLAVVETSSSLVRGVAVGYRAAYGLGDRSVRTVRGVKEGAMARVTYPVCDMTIEDSPEQFAAAGERV